MNRWRAQYGDPPLGTADDEQWESVDMEHTMVTEPADVEPTVPRSPCMTELVTQAAAAFMSPLPAAPPPPPPPPYEEDVNGDSAPAPAFHTVCHTTTPANCHRCKCKKSRCLKLYCECFAAKEFCTGCLCVNCLNTVRPMHPCPSSPHPTPCGVRSTRQRIGGGGAHANGGGGERRWRTR